MWSTPMELWSLPEPTVPSLTPNVIPAPSLQVIASSVSLGFASRRRSAISLLARGCQSLTLGGIGPKGVLIRGLACRLIRMNLFGGEL
jgi:hypothetical protein